MNGHRATTSQARAGWRPSSTLPYFVPGESKLPPRSRCNIGMWHGSLRCLLANRPSTLLYSCTPVLLYSFYRTPAPTLWPLWPLWPLWSLWPTEQWLAVGGCNRCHTQPPETLTKLLDVCLPRCSLTRQSHDISRSPIQDPAGNTRRRFSRSRATTNRTCRHHHLHFLRNVRALRPPYHVPPFPPGDMQLRLDPA